MPFSIFGFLLAAAYVPGIAGAASTPRWGVVTIGGAVLLLVSRIIDRISLAHVIGLLFLFWAFVHSSAALEAYDLRWKLAAIAVLFLVGTGLESMRGLLIGAAIGVAISSVLVVLDLAGLIAYSQTSRPSGLFVNGLYLAEFAAMVVAGLLAFRAYWWAAMCAPSILLVNNVPRGPVVALMVAGIVWMWSRSRTVALLLILLGFCLLQALVAIRPETAMERIGTWAAVGGQFSWLGHGLGAFFAEAPFFHPTINRLLHANNDLLEIGYELGAVGMLLAVSFVVLILWRQPPTDDVAAGRMMVIVFLVEGCFGFPFHLPWSAGLFALAAGRLCRFGGCRQYQFSDR